MYFYRYFIGRKIFDFLTSFFGDWEILRENGKIYNTLWYRNKVKFDSFYYLNIIILELWKFHKCFIMVKYMRFKIVRIFQSFFSYLYKKKKCLRSRISWFVCLPSSKLVKLGDSFTVRLNLSYLCHSNKFQNSKISKIVDNSKSKL